MADRESRQTHPGFADPHTPVLVRPGLDTTQRGPGADAPAKAAQAEPVVPAGKSKPKLVEIEVTHEHGPAPRTEPIRHVYEIWTQNHVYVLDTKLVCLDVRSRVESRTNTSHPLVGARLVGGQVQTPDSIEMSYPLPRPGALAVFEARKGKRRQYPHTSPVERVVLRLHIATVTGAGHVPTWDDIAGDD